MEYITLTHSNPYSLRKIFIRLRYSRMSRQPQGKSLSQPTSRMGNLERRRRDAIPTHRGSGSGTQRTESGSSYSTRTLPAESSSSHGTQWSGCSSSPLQTTRRPTSQPVKRARRRTLQTTAYSEPEGEPDAEQQIATVRLSDESRMSTRTPGDLMKLNRTQNQTQKTMMSQMTTLDQGLVTITNWRQTTSKYAGFNSGSFDHLRISRNGASRAHRSCSTTYNSV